MNTTPDWLLPHDFPKLTSGFLFYTNTEKCVAIMNQILQNNRTETITDGTMQVKYLCLIMS